MADQKLTALNKVTSIADEDLLYVVTDPSGTPASEAIDKGDLLIGANRVDSKIFTQTAINTLTDAASIAWDFDDGDLAEVVITANRAFAAPTNIRTGVKTIRVVQDGTGGHTVTWDAAFSWVSGVPPTINTGANEETYISFFTDGTNVVGIGATEAFLTETQLIETARQFIAGQGLTNTVLTISTNTTDIDFEGGNSFTLNMDSNTEIQIPTNNRPQSVQIEVTNDGGNTLTFDSGYRVLGDTPSTTDTDKILINICSFGNANPWVVVNNQP